MYQPHHFREDRLDRQHALIEACPLGLLVTQGPEGLAADAIPFLLAAADGPLGTLRAHVARANPLWQWLDHDVLVVFQGPDAYVTPDWYETKRETGKVVPTWNYAMVQVAGTARAIHDPDWLLAHVGALTATQELSRPEPWAVTDAPPPFIAGQLRGIVGIELPVARIQGKWKASQNRSPADRRGVAQGMAAMAALVAERSAEG